MELEIIFTEPTNNITLLQYSHKPLLHIKTTTVVQTSKPIFNVDSTTSATHTETKHAAYQFPVTR